MIATDYIDDSSGDLLIDNGDLVLGASDEQNINDILVSFHGWWKQFPSLGVGIPTLLKATINIPKVESLIKSQLQADGFQVGRPSVTNNGGAVVITPNAVRINF